ncbi:MAG: hypothetical protein ACK5LO_11925 [Leucobacter sp.]
MAKITTVLGDVGPDAFGVGEPGAGAETPGAGALGAGAGSGSATVLAAETLLCAPPVRPGNAGAPATEAAFERASVEMRMLGELMLGAANRDDRTLSTADAEAALDEFAETVGGGAPESGVADASAPGSTSADGVAPGGFALAGEGSPIPSRPGVVVALAGSGSAASAASLARLSRACGVAIVRGTDGTDGLDDATRGSGDTFDAGDPESLAERIAADLGAGEHPAGIVGAIPIPAALQRDPRAIRGSGRGTDGGTRAGVSASALVGADGPGGAFARIEAAAAAARASGAALVLAPEADPWGVSLPVALDPALLDRALAAVDAGGLDRARVVLTGAAALIAARPQADPALGVDPERLRALLDLGTAFCFDDLGRIPNVRTAVSDHDVALAVLRCAELGAGDRVLLSSGIRNKHRLTAFGGNGLEFVPQQFLPYLRMLGGDDALVTAVGGGNALRLLRREGRTAGDPTPHGTRSRSDSHSGSSHSGSSHSGSEGTAT